MTGERIVVNLPIAAGDLAKVAAIDADSVQVLVAGLIAGEPDVSGRRIPAGIGTFDPAIVGLMVYRPRFARIDIDHQDVLAFQVGGFGGEQEIAGIVRPAGGPRAISAVHVKW